MSEGRPPIEAASVTSAPLPWPEHPQRRAMTDELHARPFVPLTAPAELFYFAFRLETADARAAHAEHLNALLAELGVPSAEGDENYLIRETGGLRLKVERHTEFVSYTFVRDRVGLEPFDPAGAGVAPAGWLARQPGAAVAAIRLHIEAAEAGEDIVANRFERVRSAFTAESLAVSWTTSSQALVMGDFRIDPQGFTRFCVVATPEIGPRRLGRVCQRVIETETYRAFAMLALPTARELGRRLSEIDRELSGVITALVGDEGASAAEKIARHEDDPETVSQLTGLAAEIERLSAETAFRFGAARAYEAIVDERLDALREERVIERQTFREFMIRRFKPAMRTCRSTESRLEALAARAERAAQLLTARVDVALAAQNQSLLTSMDQRAAMQLRLQQTVEGLSVVAISYYAVSLAGYLLAPFADLLGVSVKALQAGVAAPIILGVWVFVRRLRQHAVDGGEEAPSALDALEKIRLFRRGKPDEGGAAVK